MRNWITSVCEVVGAVLVVVGVSQFSGPAGFIAAGVLLVLVGLGAA